MTNLRKMRVLVVEDHSVARMGLRTLIDYQRDMEVIDEAKTGAEAVEKAARLAPDLVLMDLRLPVLDGIEATDLIVKRSPETKVLVFSSFDSQADLARAQAAGARGYMLKTAEGRDLLEAMREVYSGRKHFPTLNEQSDANGGVPDLSKRDRQLLECVVKGLNNPAIAEATGLSRGTVRVYLTRLFAKLNVSNRTEAVTAAFQLGIVKPEWAEATRKEHRED